MVPRSEEQYIAYLRLKPSDATAATALQRLMSQPSHAPAGSREFTLPPRGALTYNPALESKWGYGIWG